MLCDITTIGRRHTFNNRMISGSNRTKNSYVDGISFPSKSAYFAETSFVVKTYSKITSTGYSHNSSRLKLNRTYENITLRTRKKAAYSVGLPSYVVSALLGVWWTLFLLQWFPSSPDYSLTIEVLLRLRRQTMVNFRGQNDVQNGSNKNRGKPKFSLCGNKINFENAFDL